MPKYKEGQFAKVNDIWYEINHVRMGMFNGKCEYFLSGSGRKGWIAEEQIKEVTKEQKEIH